MRTEAKADPCSSIQETIDHIAEKVNADPEGVITKVIVKRRLAFTELFTYQFCKASLIFTMSFVIVKLHFHMSPLHRNILTNLF